MNPNRLCCAAFWLLLFSLTGCAPKEIFESSWKPQPIKTDGYATEWEVPLRYYDNETKLNYNIANDKKNLYICVRITDEPSQMKVLRAGLQLWIDTTGKKLQQVGVLFPLPNKEMSLEGSHQGRRRAQSGTDEAPKPDVSKTRKRLLAGANEMQLWGFNSPLGGITPVSNTSGVKAAINWDSSGVMIYELTLPFNTFCHINPSGKDTAKIIGFSATINGLPAPKHDAGSTDDGGGMGNSGGGGMRGGGMGGGSGMRGGGMGGGGMRGGGGRGGNRGEGNSTAMYESKGFWIKFHLAAAQ